MEKLMFHFDVAKYAVHRHIAMWGERYEELDAGIHPRFLEIWH